MSDLNGNLVFAAGIAGFATVNAGIALSISSPTLIPISHDLELSDLEGSFYSSCLSLAAGVSSYISGPVVQGRGPRAGLIGGSVLYAVGSALQALAYDMFFLSVGRLLVGFALGTLSIGAPVFLNHIATRQWKGAFGNITQLGIVNGILLINVLGLFMGWRALNWFCVITTGMVAVILFMFIPDDPQTKQHSGQLDEAKTSAMWYGHNPQEYMDEPVVRGSTGNDSSDGKGIGVKEVLMDPNLRHCLRIAVTFTQFQQWSGINIVIFFVTPLAAIAGFSNPGTIAIYIFTFQVIMTMVSTLAVDRFGQRLLMMASGGGMCGGAGLLALFFYLQPEDLVSGGLGSGESDVHAVHTELALIALLVFIAAFSIGLGPLPWAIVADVFPTYARATGTAIAVGGNWFAAFLVTLTVSSLLRAIGGGTSFLLYSIICAAEVVAASRMLGHSTGTHHQRNTPTGLFSDEEAQPALLEREDAV
eukprot:Clim_evm3s238 gene=Clim_evmTU3s238